MAYRPKRFSLSMHIYKQYYPTSLLHCLDYFNQTPSSFMYRTGNRAGLSKQNGRYLRLALRFREKFIVLIKVRNREWITYLKIKLALMSSVTQFKVFQTESLCRFVFTPSNQNCFWGGVSVTVNLFRFESLEKTLRRKLVLNGFLQIN